MIAQNAVRPIPLDAERPKRAEYLIMYLPVVVELGDDGAIQGQRGVLFDAEAAERWIAELNGESR